MNIKINEIIPRIEACRDLREVLRAAYPEVTSGEDKAKNLETEKLIDHLIVFLGRVSHEAYKLDEGRDVSLTCYIGHIRPIEITTSKPK